MGESQSWLFEPTFQQAVKVKAADERLTSDGGAILLREADHRLGLTESLAAKLHDPRRPECIRYTLTELLRERLYSLALGYAAQDDLDRLAHDPALRIACWDRTGEATLDERLASQPTQSRLIDTLARFPQNLRALRHALADWSQRWLCSTGPDRRAASITIDVDSFLIPCYGQQPGSAYNGHYQDSGYHPLVASFSVGGKYDSAKEGHRLGNGFLHAVLRAGNVHTANGVLRFLQNVIAKGRQLARSFDLRLDAGFTDGRTLDFLTDHNVRFLGRLKANAVLDRLAEPHLKRPVGRPPRDGYEDVIDLGPYRAEPWRHAQRLLLVILDRPDPKRGQLAFEPDYFFLVTNWREEERTGEQVLDHYRERGTFEDRLGEFRAAVRPSLSSPEFRENEALLLLSLLACNLASMLREEFESSQGTCFDLQRFQNTVLKAGGKVIKHARRRVLVIARAVAPFWQKVAERIARWIVPARWRPQGPKHRDWMPPPKHAHRTLVLRT
jgi:hypothetical protein